MNPSTVIKAMSYQDPTISELLRVSRSIIIEYNQVASNAEISKDFGFFLDSDVRDTINDRLKIQLLFSEVKNCF